MDDYFSGTAVRPHLPQQAPQQVVGAPAWPPAPASGGNPLLIGLVVALVAFVGIGVLAAVAIPAFLDQRDLSRRTVVSAPELVLGMPHLTDAVSAAAERKLLALPGPGDHVAGVYGVEQVRLLVGAARYHLSGADREDFLKDAASQVREEGLALRDVAPGPLGGTLRCGSSPDRLMTLCVFVDGGSYGVVVLTGGSDDDTGTARAAREAFVRRT